MPPLERGDTASTAQGRDEVIAEDALRLTDGGPAGAQVATRRRHDAPESQVVEVSEGKGRKVDGGGGVGEESAEGEDDAEVGSNVGGAAVYACTADVGDNDVTVAAPPNVHHLDGAPLECVVIGQGAFFDTDPIKFLHTVVVAEQGDRLYRIIIHHRVTHICNAIKAALRDLNLDIEKLTKDAEEIPLDVFPRYSAEEFGSEHRRLSDESVYVKRPNLTTCASGAGNCVSVPMKAEMRTFQRLAQSPHKNIVKYRGCVLRNGRVIALCLDMLECDLHDVVENKELWLQLDKNRVMRSIRCAVAHLHELGICHNDIKPANVMLDSNNEAVLIDFDSSMPVGEKLSKGGTLGWAEYDVFVSAKRNDTDALAKLETYLMKGPPS